MKEEVYSLFREYLTPEKGYRLLTVKGRENKIIIAVKISDNRKIYKTLKGTDYESGADAVKRLEQIGDSIVEKIRDSVGMNKNGEALFDSMSVIDNVSVLLKAVTASNKYGFDDLVDYSDNNIYFNYVVDYIGVKNKAYNKKLAEWYWSDNYYKVMLERSPYEFKKEYNNEFIKVYGASGKNNKSNRYEIFGVVNSDLEMSVLAGTKVSNSFELAPNTNAKLLGLSCDWRNTADNNGILQYNTYLTSDKVNVQLRKLSFTTSALLSMKLSRNKKLCLIDVIRAQKNINLYKEGKYSYKDVEDYKKDRTIMAQFMQILSDSRFGVQYTVVDSLAFMRQYDDGFKLLEVKDNKFNIHAKLLVHEEFKCGYILEGTKFRRLKLPEKFPKSLSRYIANAYKVVYREFSDDNGYMTKDSCLLSLTEINAILYGCDYDVIFEHNIFEEDITEHKIRKNEHKKEDIKVKKSELEIELELKNKELEAKNKELELLKKKNKSLENYISNYIKKNSAILKDLEQNLKNAATSGNSLIASMRNFEMDAKSVLKETKK